MANETTRIGSSTGEPFIRIPDHSQRLLDQRITQARQFAQEYVSERNKIVIRKDPQWEGQMRYVAEKGERAIWTCGIATLGNGLRVLGVYEDALDAEPRMVDQAKEFFDPRTGMLSDTALTRLVHNRHERKIRLETNVPFQQTLTGLKDGKVALQDVGGHLVLLTNIETQWVDKGNGIKEQVVGVRKVDPLQRQPTPQFVSLDDLARIQPNYRLLSRELPQSPASPGKITIRPQSLTELADS